MSDPVEPPDPSDPRRILKDLEQRARKRFGQHFLARASIVERMVRAAQVAPGDRVLEIGPGLGILTQALLHAGADLTAVEVDDDLAARVVEVYPAVRLVHGDATRQDWAAVCPGAGWKVVANLPYNVGTGLVMDLARQPERFTRLVVMLQAEVVERMVAPPGNKTYGALTVELRARGVARAIIGVPREAFVPPPKVRSLVVQVDLYDAPRVGKGTPAHFDRVVKAAFSQRRKTVRNALSALFGGDRSERALAEAGIDPQLRAEALPQDAFVALSDALVPPN
ncbi:MAG: ribosomal RNA small subunit methyltransferase A [Alphaproteobacteria bacterium]|nr:ribosomal RNA small subunit methyltransferase A [Alphaproteobacteria bacterium]